MKRWLVGQAIIVALALVPFFVGLRVAAWMTLGTGTALWTLGRYTRDPGVAFRIGAWSAALFSFVQVLFWRAA